MNDSSIEPVHCGESKPSSLCFVNDSSIKPVHCGESKPSSLCIVNDFSINPVHCGESKPSSLFIVNDSSIEPVHCGESKPSSLCCCERFLARRTCSPEKKFCLTAALCRVFAPERISDRPGVGTTQLFLCLSVESFSCCCDLAL